MTAHVRPALGAGLVAAALVLVAPPAHAAAPDATTADTGRGASSRPPGWAPVGLGTLGGARTMPTAVNDRGQVVGRSELGYADPGRRAGRRPQREGPRRDGHG